MSSRSSRYSSGRCSGRCSVVIDIGRPLTSAIARMQRELAVEVDEVGDDLEHALARSRRSRRAMPSSSSAVAVRLGVWRPSDERCATVRDVVKPSAPASMRLGREPAHRRDLVGGRHLVVVGAAVAHDVAAQRGVRDLRADVDRVRRAVEHVEVLGEALPAPA